MSLQQSDRTESKWKNLTGSVQWAGKYICLFPVACPCACDLHANGTSHIALHTRDVDGLAMVNTDSVSLARCGAVTMAFGMLNVARVMSVPPSIAREFDFTGKPRLSYRQPCLGGCASNPCMCSSQLPR